MKKNSKENLIQINDIHDNDCRVIFDGSFNEVPVQLGKRYRGSGCLTPTGDFFFHRYNEKPLADGESTNNKLAEENGCTIYEYKDKFKIVINICKVHLTESRLFLAVTEQIKFMNRILFRKSKKSKSLKV